MIISVVKATTLKQ